MVLPFASIGSLLPTWMFINALQLIAHLPLLNSEMPGNAHYFLNKYLDYVRWYDKDFIEKVEKKLISLKKYDVDVGSFSELLKSCGYEHLFAHNMMLIFIGIALIVFVWICFAIKDWIGTCSKSKSSFMKRRHENSCNNFAIRFFYEFFLEFCIVVSINLSVYDYGEFSTDFSYSISIELVLLLVGLMFFVLYLLFKNGPYVEGFYKKNTALKGTWGVREINHDFDTYAYLKANKKKNKKRRNWFKFVTGSERNAKTLDPEGL